MEIEYIWHGRRYWVQEPKAGQHIGWNTRFEPCFVLRKTAKRIFIKSPTFGEMQLNRLAFERDGKVYHSRVHEYFYPHPYESLSDLLPKGKVKEAFTVLGLTWPASVREIKRAYKRKARACHPDTGGTHEAFLNLQRAMETAIRGF